MLKSYNINMLYDFLFFCLKEHINLAPVNTTILYRVFVENVKCFF